MIPRTERFRPNLEARKIKGAIAYVILVGAVAVGIIGLSVLLIQVFVQGVDWLRPELIFNFRLGSRNKRASRPRCSAPSGSWASPLCSAFP